MDMEHASVSCAENSAAGSTGAGSKARFYAPRMSLTLVRK